MVFPVANPQTQQWFTTLQSDVINLQSYCLQVQAETAGGGKANAPDVLNVAVAALQLQSDIATISNSATLVAAVVTMFNNQPGWSAVNVLTEFSTINTLAANIVTAIVGANAEYPHDASNPPHLLDRVWSNNQIVSVTLTAAQLPNTMAAIAAYIAEVPAASQIPL
jgi:hypothetical protein